MGLLHVRAAVIPLYTSLGRYSTCNDIVTSAFLTIQQEEEEEEEKGVITLSYSRR